MQKKRDYFEEDEDEWDIYTEEGINRYVDEDEISSEEHGFMSGYLCMT